MRLWSKLFGSVTPDEGSGTDSTAPDVCADSMLADCGFCGQRRIQCERSAQYLYPVWTCSCGASGSGAWLPDLDDVGDQLLEMLGIKACVSEPCVPTDNPAISIQRYDVDKVERNLARILTSHGYEFRILPGGNPKERLFWARKIK